jgi:tetratricopeptide (TPR) repeat protein
MFCSNCGKQINDGSKFCQFCGANAAGEAQQQQAPNDASSLYSLGDGYYNQGNFAEAIKCYEKALSMAPPYNAAALYFNLGFASFEIGAYTQAINYYNKTVSIDPNNSAAYTNLGNAYYNIGNVSKQIENYRISARLGNEGSKQWLRENELFYSRYSEKDDIIKTMRAEGVSPEDADDQVFQDYVNRYLLKEGRCTRCGGKLNLFKKCKSCGASAFQGTM